MPAAEFSGWAVGKLVQQNRKQAAGAKETLLPLRLEIDADLDRVHGAAFAPHVKPERAAERDALGEPSQPESLAPGERQRLPTGTGGEESEPGANDVLTHGFTRSPSLAALRAKSPAASIALGLAVLVQLVIAAMTTSPFASE
jgi:hypothetical protein